MSFEEIIKFTLEHEGGYSKDLHDPGGETKYGISKRSHPNEDILNLTIERAKEIYKEVYWNPLKNITDDKLRMAAFDTAVNVGVGRLKTWLTMCKDCTILLDRRERYYHDLVSNRPNMGRYLKGWINRVNDLRELLK